MCDIIRRSLFFPLISLTVLLCNLLIGEASPAVHKQQGLLVSIKREQPILFFKILASCKHIIWYALQPDGFVAGLPLTEQEFNTPIDTLRKINLIIY